MQNGYMPRTSSEEQHIRGRGHVLARQAGVLGGPRVVTDSAEELYGLNFQLDSGHGSEPDPEPGSGGLRVYELDYVPPGRATMHLAKIYVTGDLPCDVMDRSRGAWLRFEAATEYWYLNNDALAALAATEAGGKILFRILHESCPSGVALDDIVGAEVVRVVEQVAPRDVAWQSSDERDWASLAYSFSLSSETPAYVSTKQGCLLGLRFTLTKEVGSSGWPLYRIVSTEWSQGAGEGALFAGWRTGEGVVLEQTDVMPEGSLHVARCDLAMASTSKLAV